MEINRTAPVRARRTVDVEAPIERVWDVLANVDDWPRWNADVKSAGIAGPVAPGTQFRWKAGPGTIESKLEDVERPQRLGWTGKTFGLSAVHVWRLESRDGGTHVTTEESMEGRLARPLRGMLTKNLEKSLDTWISGLKAESEIRAR